MLVKLLKRFKKLVKVRSSPRIDSTVFRMHYGLTTYLLFIFCVLVTATNMLGKPIQCVHNLKKAKSVFNTFCFITNTFTINTTDNLGTVTKDHLITNHSYYQWVPFVLFFMGCTFYVPHLIWKTKENKILKQLLQNLNKHTILEDTSENMTKILKYLEISYGLNGHYCMFYFLCEILNLVNVVGQMFVLDWFFDGFFFKKAYGSEVFRYMSQTDEERGMDPMIRAFPRMTKCTFWYVGPSSTLANNDYLCILSQNNLNEKIFLGIWLWYIALTTITAAHLVLRVLVLVVPALRQYLMEFRGALQSQQVSLLVATLPLGDYCLLELFHKNLDLATFQDLLLLLLKSRTYGDSYKAFTRQESDIPMIR